MSSPVCKRNPLLGLQPGQGIYNVTIILLFGSGWPNASTMMELYPKKWGRLQARARCGRPARRDLCGGAGQPASLPRPRFYTASFSMCSLPSESLPLRTRHSRSSRPLPQFFADALHPGSSLHKSCKRPLCPTDEPQTIRSW